MCDYRPIGLYEITLCIHTQVVSAFTWVYKQQKKMRIRELHSHVWQTDRVSNKIMRAAWTKLKCKSIKQINWVNVLRHTNTDNRLNNKKSTNVIVIKSATREKAYFPVNDCQSIASPARGRGWSADEFTYSDILSATVTLDIGNWDENNHTYLKCIYEEHAATSREMENIMSAIANAGRLRQELCCQLVCTVGQPSTTAVIPPSVLISDSRLPTTWRAVLSINAHVHSNFTVWSVPGDRTTSFTPNVPQEHRDYTNLYKLMTAGSPHLHHCTYIYVSRKAGLAGRRDPDASLDSH